MPLDPAQFAQDPAATQTLAWMREGRWRKARDAAKELVKRERERYIPLLIEANVGLTREMFGKGLLKEAATVVEYLATIAPASLVAGLRAELAAPVIKPSAPDPVKAEAAEWWAAALRVDEAGTAAISLTDLAAVDLLVTAALLPSVEDGDERELRLARELAAVRAACSATGDGHWDAAREALQGLPRQSVFRNWRFFLRGLRCFFEDEPDTARQCFGELPPHGALARAARAFDPALVPAGPLAPVSARVPLYLAGTGQPAAWSGPLVAAAAAWKAGKRVESFEGLLAGMKGAFPAIAPGLPAWLTKTTLPYRTRMNRVECEAADTLMDRLGLDRGGKRLPSLEALLAVMQPMCLAEADLMPCSILDRYWRSVIELWNRCEGPNPLRDAVAWEWLGENLSDMTAHLGPAKPPRNTPPDFGRAVKAYENAVEADPSNETAALGLLTLVQRSGDLKAHKRLLDDLLQRFPRNKPLLVAAAAQSSKDKAFDNALVQLRAALAIDPLDKDIKGAIMIALASQTRELLSKKRPVAQQWAAMEPLLEDRPPRKHLMLSRWMARMSQALLDPEPGTALQAREDAVRLAPSLLECLLLEDWLAIAYRITPRPEWLKEWKAAIKPGARDWVLLLAVIDQHAFISQIKEWGKAMNTRACGQVLDILATLIGKNLKKDPAGLIAFLDRTAVLEKGITQHARDVIDCCMRDVTDELDENVDPSNKKLDPRLRLASLIMDERSGECFYIPEHEFLGDLDSVAAAAAALGMPEIAARAKALREKVTGPSRSDSYDDPFGRSGFPYDDDDDDDDDDMGDEDMGDDVIGGIPHLAELLEAAIKSGDSQALHSIRSGLLSFGLPKNEVDQIINSLTLKYKLTGLPPSGTKPKPVKPAVRKKPSPQPLPPPSPPPKKKPKPGKPAPPVNPDQPELF